MIKRSFVIPVIDLSPHSPYNILTLLEDLKGVDGEVICIFNSEEVYELLKSHNRIDKYCHNNMNAGVSRSWNLGINMAEAGVIFIMNADLHISKKCIEEMEQYLLSLDKAVIVGPQGSHLDLKRLAVTRYFQKGTFDKPVKTHDVSGFLFAINGELYHQYRFCFDIRYSPCFFEEWDMGMQVLLERQSLYAVPVIEFDHHWGMSQERDDREIVYFGKTVKRGDVMIENRKKFVLKWCHQIPFHDDLLKEAGVR
ncbi:MAG TPA: glycosyltransferase [Nitrospirae bacterium]|nr:glycosyltransferase [Nitrospirota bacterium]